MLVQKELGNARQDASKATFHVQSRVDARSWQAKTSLIKHAEPRTPELFEAYDWGMSEHAKWLDTQNVGALWAIDLLLQSDHDDEDDDDDDVKETDDEEDEEEDDGYSE
jgi:hypothetical protein